MKVREMLKIQEAFENKTIPSDLLEEENYYWSESKETHIRVLDLDLHHLIRIVIKELDDHDTKSNKLYVLDALSVILKQTDDIRKKLYERA